MRPSKQLRDSIRIPRVSPLLATTLGHDSESIFKLCAAKVILCWAILRQR